MIKILFLIVSSLICIGSALAEDVNHFIKGGYYIISVKDRKEGENISSNNVYIELTKENSAFMYTNSGNRFILKKGNGKTIDSKFESNQTAVTLEGEITSENSIQGKYIITKLKTGKRKELFFSLVTDISPHLKKADFIRIFDTAQKKRNKWVYPKNTAEGQRIRKVITDKAKENNMNFTIYGRIVDYKNQPISNATVDINILKIDPDGKLGGKIIQRSLLTDIKGEFNVQRCFGVSVNIYVKKQGFYNEHKQIDGPVELKKNAGKTIIIKLKPNNQNTQVKSP